MPSEKSAALLIRVIDFSETSNVVTLFTEDFGKVSAVAKGGRRPKGPFEFALDLLALCRVVFIPKPGDSLAILTEAKLEHRFHGADQGLKALYSGYYVAELLNSLTDEDDPHPELFQVAQDTLSRLERGDSAALVVARFEAQLLRLLGHAPSLTQCAETGKPLTLAGTVPFGLTAGGVLSPEVRSRHTRVVLVPAAVLQIWNVLAREDSAWETIELNPSLAGHMRSLLNQYFAHLIGHPLKMHKYLGTLV